MVRYSESDRRKSERDAESSYDHFSFYCRASFSLVGKEGEGRKLIGRPLTSRIER